MATKQELKEYLDDEKRRLKDRLKRATKQREIEVYCGYEKVRNVHPKLPKKIMVKMDLEELQILVKYAGLYLHPPDEGTGVVVIHPYKDREDPRQYPNGIGNGKPKSRKSK
jgi:hypothetical protein